ncbi:MAG: biosynthetic peptidoglycan transglycosylase, partial [Sphingobium sp.]
MAGSGKSKAARTGVRKWLVRGVKIGLAAAVAGLLAVVIAVVIAMQSLPSYDSLKSSPNGQMIRVHAADGSVIVSLGPSFGQWLPYEQIPQVMVDAMIATEDKRFYLHPGIDPVGMARAAWVAVERRGSGRRWQGASTITQQVTRNIFLNNSYSFGRKVREMVLALAMERKFSKRQILELYLNKVYFGGGAYGIDAASRKFFGHPATRLDLPEAAIIAGLVKAPSSYSPTADADAAIGRAGVVLDLMEENDKISASERASADLAGVKMAP